MNLFTPWKRAVRLLKQVGHMPTIREVKRLSLCLLLGGSLTFAAEFKPDEGTIAELPERSVTATRAPSLSEGAPLPILRFDEARFRETPTLTTDDFLRQVPNFSLFRRTSSLAANPTTQGASLRGIGPSGTSRSLVLWDGVPFNDAFGGWVYWSQLNPQTIEAVEVVRGGGSAAWGNTALGGVIQIIPRRPQTDTLEAEFQLGTFGTRQASVYASQRDEKFAVSVEARRFETDGYQRVRRDQRGSVDKPTNSAHRLVNTVIEYAPSSRGLLTLRSGYFKESRGNGTQLAENSTESLRFHGKWEWISRDFSQWRLDAYGTQTDYTNSFSAVAADRNSEQLVLDQFDVPSNTLGTSLQRTGPLFDLGQLTLGADFRWVEGETNERVVFQGANRIAGGQQILGGLFLEHEGTPHPEWRWQLGLRGDYWRSYDGFIEPPNAAREAFPDRDAFIFNGRAGLSYTVTDKFVLRGALYQAFRTPTINELYRPFQVGADVTQANASLEPERLIGGEVGLDWQPLESLTLRTTAFINQVRDPILNVTTGTSPQGGQLRQRQNIDRTEIRGLETELSLRIAEGWRSYLNYTYTEAEVREARQQPGLEGLRLAQVPRHGMTAGISYTPDERGFGANLQVRWSSDQFEDDLNTRRLKSYWLVDLSVRYQFAAGREVFAAVENALDRAYADGITGANLVTEGAPRTARIGLRYRF